MYFEVDDIKHRHNAYWDSYNTHGWTRTPDSTLTWNYTRGLMAALPAVVGTEVGQFLFSRYKHLRSKYEPPRNLKQLGSFWDGMKKIDNHKSALKSRIQYGSCIAVFDVAVRYATYYYYVGGWWSGFHTVNVDFWKKIIPTLMVGLATGPLAHPFEVVKAAYTADATFPKELQKGYKSYFDALRRIPQEEGLTYLTRGIINTWMRNSLQTAFFFYIFDFMKDFLHPIQIAGQWTYEQIKIPSLFIGASAACVVSYPFGVLSKFMCEMQPVDKNGGHAYRHNYRVAMRELWFQHDFGALFPGFSRTYYWRTMSWMMVSGWIADDLGIFSKWKNSWLDYFGNNTMEDMFV